MEEGSSLKGVSFKFAKTLQHSKVDKTKIQNEEDKHLKEPDFVKSVEDNEIQSSEPMKREQTELIIPLITRNVWRHPSEPEQEKVSPREGQEEEPRGQPLSLEEQALREIIQDSKQKKDEPPKASEFLVVPLLMQNRVPEGFETDARLDVALRPNSSNLEDYDKVPIEHFGLAALKGMGWKPGDGIGRTNKRCVAPVEVELRPRGLGLGANLKDLDVLKAQAGRQEDVPLVVGASVCVVEGNHKGAYGEVQSLDDETGRVVIKMLDSDKLLTFPEIFLKGVCKDKLKKENKVMNRAQYEKYVSEAAAEGTGRDHPERREDCFGRKRTSREDRSHSLSPSTDGYKKRSRGEHKKKKRNKDRHREGSNSSPSAANLQVHPQLRMRIIDQKYKKGKYYNQKVVIEDVISPTTCVCRTEDGKILEDIEVRMLETVIPRSEHSHVMVLQGEFRGRVASILSRDKTKCLATLNLLPDRQRVIKLSYDSVCEFLGDVTIYE